ncbi:MAG TPA: hypothetical protein VHU80_25220, partial [Polyangiaceae bacterium]|nr:hypothetical protein [Polyangiaceae bacterium]
MDAYALVVTVRLPNEPVRHLTIDAETAVVGSGAHCEVRLGSDDADREHLSLRADATGGVFAVARSQKPPPLLNGVPFAQGRLLPDAVIRVGRAELTVGAVETHLSPKASARDGEKSNPVVYVIGAIGFPLAFYWLLTMKPPERGLPASVPPPQLFDETRVARCPEDDGRAAAMLGAKALLEAESARERAPFNAEDGIAAVASFERAAACFKTAGSPAASEEATNAGTSLRSQLNDEFHVHRVRLERALATRRYEDAR